MQISSARILVLIRALDAEHRFGEAPSIQCCSPKVNVWLAESFQRQGP